MKKILLRVFAAVFALTVSLPGMAEKQPIPRAGGEQSASELNGFTSRAMPKGVLTAQGVSLPQFQNRSVRATSYIRENSDKFNSEAASRPTRTEAPRATVARSQSDGPFPEIVGYLTYSNLSGQKKGIYQIPGTAAEGLKLLKEGVNAAFGGVIKDDVYYATNYSSIMGMFTVIDVYAWNVKTWEKIWNFSPSTFDNVVYNSAAAYDPTTEKIYAVTFNANGENLQFATIEYGNKTSNVTRIADFNYNITSLACDSNGQLYAIINSVENNVTLATYLTKINKTTGTYEIVGNTGELSQYPTGAVIDQKTNRMYWPVCLPDQTSYMCEVNLQTGAATRLYELPNNEQFLGVQILPPAALDNAPAAAQELSLDFANGSLTGKVNFTIPTKYFDGSDASGEVSYSITANGEDLASGQSAFGAQESVEVTLDAPGVYEIIVVLSNEVGNSPEARVTSYIGNGIPEAPKPTATYADGTLTVAWDAVTTSSDGGYIDASAVTYTLKDTSSGEILAEGLTATSWSTALAAPEEMTVYQYSVTATCNGRSSNAGTTKLILGFVTPPYENNFETPSDLEPFTVLDSNEDGYTWVWYDYDVWYDPTASFKGARVRYHADHPTDDWLISPPLNLEAGVAYYVSMDVKGESSTVKEKIEVCFGRSATADGMTSVIIEPTEIASAKFQTYGGFLNADEAGLYYVGIHGISNANAYGLSIDNFKVTKVGGAAAPGLVTDVEIIPGSYGELVATINFKAPTLNIGGTELTNISRIDVERNGEIIATKTGVTPGADVSVEDSVETFGTYTYTITAYNSDGPGQTYTQEAYIGVPVPANVEDISASVSGNELTLTWTPVTTDKYGQPVYPEQVTYVVVNEEGAIVADNLTEPTWTYTYTGAKQQFLRFGVQARTEGGRSEGILGTSLIAMGPAYVDFACSFPDASFGDYIFYTISNGGQWMRVSLDGANGSTMLTSVEPYDGDNGCIAMEGKYEDNASTLVTGVISLANATNPGISFYTYAINDDDANELMVSVAEPNSNNFVVVKTVTVMETGESGWNKVMIPLDDYAGQDIQVAITATTKVYAYTFIDAITVGSMVDYDLAARSIAAPATVTAGDDYSVLVNVVNEGFRDVENYSVELYANGDLVATKDCSALASEATASVEFVRNFTPFDTESVLYSAKVVFAEDTNEDNNTTNEIEVEPKVSKLPVPLELSGECTYQGNELTWQEPDIESALPDPITEDFEDAEGFQTDYKDWIFVDVDQATIGGFTGLTLPGIPTFSGPSSWFVFDSTGDTFDYYNTFGAASGKKYLACLYRKDEGRVDDWAISPELYGKAQTVTFKARVYMSTYAERLEVWYSTGSTNVEDFIQVEGASITVTSQSWNEYSIDLPAGAKRFALRCNTLNGYMLLVDDVSFIPSDAVVNLSLVGYDIYRDGVKINNEVVTDTKYTDTETVVGEMYTYNVVAIYTTGASAPSNGCQITTLGVDNMFAGITISKAKGAIVVTGADGEQINVVGIDGKMVYSGLGQDKTVIPVDGGVYVVKAGNKQAKLFVE